MLLRHVGGTLPGLGCLKAYPLLHNNHLSGGEVREVMRRICVLQAEWSDRNTPEMKERGALVRETMPSWLRSNAGQLAVLMGRPLEDFDAQGRDGTGRKTETPWVRFHSKVLAPTPRDGWYCVYLFHAAGAGVYLALGHGSTTWTNGEFRPRGDRELFALTAWAKGVLATQVERLSGLTSVIDLGAQRSQLGESYAKATAVARWYPRDQIPEDAALLRDACLFADLLGRLYQQGDLGRSAGQVAPEVSSAEAAVEAIAKPQSPVAQGSSQGYGLTADERRAVELHAMHRATAHLEELGYVVTDVSAKRSFDLEAVKNGETLIVEVKGSTGPADQILLTAAEVAIHRQRFPACALLVVSMIELHRGSKPRATGGSISFQHPWRVMEEHLTPIAYRYTRQGEEGTEGR